jgi:hypothetical protein
MGAPNGFIGSFLLSFENILNPVSLTIDNLQRYVDAPHAARGVPLLSAWIGRQLARRVAPGASARVREAVQVTRHPPWTAPWSRRSSTSRSRRTSVTPLKS